MTREQVMTRRRLDWTLRARGADLAAWPAPDRAAALALARTDPASRRLLADALVDALAEEPGPIPDATVQHRLQARIRRALAPVGYTLRWGTLTLGLAAGLYFGLQQTEAENPSDLAATMQATTPATVLAAIDP